MLYKKGGNAGARALRAVTSLFHARNGHLIIELKLSLAYSGLHRAPGTLKGVGRHA